VRLLPNDDLTVTQTIYASGVGLTKTDVAEIDMDPMTPYRIGDKGPVAIRLREDRALWRDFLALVPSHVGWTPSRTVEHAEFVREETGDDAVLPVHVLGQGRVPAQAKLERWRAETFYLPDVILRERQAIEVVEACLEEAEEVGNGLRAVSRALAEKLLSTGDRKPHRDDVSRISGTLPLLTRYWSGLGSHFPSFLNRFQPGWNAAEVRGLWVASLLDTADAAWSATVSSVGVDARTLRAIQHAENVLHKRLSPLRDRAA
jgi:CRISPR system Cascade subunit CasA